MGTDSGVSGCFLGSQGPPVGLPLPLGPGLLELQGLCWQSWGLCTEVTHLRDR